MMGEGWTLPLERGLSIEKPDLSLPNFQRLLNCNQRRAADPANVPYASCYQFPPNSTDTEAALTSFTTASTPLSPGTAAMLCERGLELLDFYLVRDRVAACATFPPAKRLAEDMAPSSDPEIVRALQQETTEARILLNRGLSLRLPPVEHTPETDKACRTRRHVDGRGAAGHLCPAFS